MTPTDDPQLGYIDPGVEIAPPKRSAGTWAKLLAVWTLGLFVWAFYLLAIVYLILQLL